MRIASVAAVVGALAAGTCLAAPPEPVTVPPAEASAWIRHTVPLPKQIEILSKVAVDPAEVSVAAPAGDDALVGQAAAELRQSLGQAADRTPPARVSFTVTLQLGGAESEELKKLRNADQAYKIVPEAGGAGLRLVALGRPGLYYAAKTLQQLIRAKAVPGRVELPLPRVTDWPDLEDRGLWGSNGYHYVRWMADRKMNILEQISLIGVDEQGRVYARPKNGHEPMVREGPRYAVRPVPVVLHLEQVSGKGVVRAHPETLAQGGQAGSFCYAKPAVTDVLADWIAELRGLPHVEAVDVWMTENLHGQGGCRCAECAKAPYPVNEVRVILNAWRKAREKTGKEIGLWVLTSEETEAHNEAIFRELPPEVRVWYYHSLLTYNASRSPMLRSYLAGTARGGRWIGVVPSLTVVHFDQPFTSAHFVHGRMNEFADQGMSGLLGFATPAFAYALFNIEAAAEWSWNAKGRSPREFALSWAVRRGLKDPETFAEWSETLGPVTWDLYGSDWPSGEVRRNPDHVAKRLKQGKLGELGTSQGVYKSPWGDIPSLERLDQDVAAADRAVVLARELGAAEFVEESAVIQGYARSLKALWTLRSVVTPEGIAAGDRETARANFKTYVESLAQAAEALPRWENVLPRQKGATNHLGRSIESLRKTMEEMKAVAAELKIDLN